MEIDESHSEDHEVANDGEESEEERPEERSEQGEESEELSESEEADEESCSDSDEMADQQTAVVDRLKVSLCFTNAVSIVCFILHNDVSLLSNFVADTCVDCFQEFMANRELCTTEEELDEFREWAALCAEEWEPEETDGEWAELIETDDEME